MENELDYAKKRLEAVNSDLKNILEENMYLSDPGKILILWGKLQCLMGLKLTAEWEIERIEKERNQNAEIH